MLKLILIIWAIGAIIALSFMLWNAAQDYRKKGYYDFTGDDLSMCLLWPVVLLLFLCYLFWEEFILKIPIALAYIIDNWKTERWTQEEIDEADEGVKKLAKLFEEEE